MASIPLPIAPDHPSLAGHFPGHPIVPGVVLLDTAQLTLELATGLTMQGLVAVKFVSPALPGEPLTLGYEIHGAAARFDIYCGSRKVVTGRFCVAQGLYS